jgi:hypothetical protein
VYIIVRTHQSLLFRIFVGRIDTNASLEAEEKRPASDATQTLICMSSRSYPNHCIVHTSFNYISFPIGSIGIRE